MSSTQRSISARNFLLTTKDSACGRTPAIVCAWLFAVFVLGYFAIGPAVYYWKEHSHHDEAGAVSCLSAVHTMQENYIKDHGSYASTFPELGVPLGGRLEGDVLIWNGAYRYHITPIHNQAGSVDAYNIEARPITYSYHSERSYMMDQTGAIHFTAKNRQAISNDPILSGHH